MRTAHFAADRFASARALRLVLLLCGIASALLYAAMNVFVAAADPSYDSMSQTVSELSAIGAPTRRIWVKWSFVYSALVIAFAYGVWLCRKNSRKLRTLGVLIFLYGILGVGWPFAPMHTREVLAAGGATSSDALHIVFSVVTVVLMLAAMSVGSTALTNWFRMFTLATMVVIVIFGIMTAMVTPEMESNLPTPWMGLWERIDIAAFLLWNIILAVLLLVETSRTRFPVS